MQPAAGPGQQRGDQALLGQDGVQHHLGAESVLLPHAVSSTASACAAMAGSARRVPAAADAIRARSSGLSRSSNGDAQAAVAAAPRMARTSRRFICAAQCARAGTR